MDNESERGRSMTNADGDLSAAMARHDAAHFVQYAAHVSAPDMDYTEPAPDTPQARILDAAEALFMEDGYAAVSLRQVAEAADLRQATLYYHFPEGKESLYVAVVQRFFVRQQTALTAAIAQAPVNLRAQLEAVFRWLGTSRPEVHYTGMLYADLPALAPARAQQVSQIVFHAMFSPLAAMFAAAMARGEARMTSPEFLAGSVLALADGITSSMRQPHAVPRAVMEREMCRLILDGVLSHTPQSD